MNDFLAREIAIRAPGGIPIAASYVETEPSGLPLLVALHGGGYNRQYFDGPEHSFLRLAHRNGFPVVALDRPSYGASGQLRVEHGWFAGQASALNEAIGQLWADLDDEELAGIVLVGHSIGGAIALLIAAHNPDWPLLGVSVTGIGDVPPAAVAEAWESLPDIPSIDLPLDRRVVFMWGPPDTYSRDVPGATSPSFEPIPRVELIEVNTTWVERYHAVAGRITVAVHYRLAEFEALWVATDETIAGFANRLSSAPFVDAGRYRFAGHNIDHHYVGRALHLEQLSFAERCAVEYSRRYEAVTRASRGASPRSA
jgi:pimeloyl-ACP methyl ester carboxylesterase